MRKITRCFITALFLSTTAFVAKAETNREIVNGEALGAQLSQADMETCATAFGEPYESEARSIESKMRQIVAAGGFDVELFWATQEKKIEALSHIGMTGVKIAIRNSNEQEMAKIREGCQRDLILIVNTHKSLDVALKKLNKKALRPSAKRSPPAQTCAKSADYYQERFRMSGKISELTCFQRAARRELDGAQSD